MVSRRYAYVEFTEPNLVSQALALNESLFRGRNLKVRTHAPCLLGPVLISFQVVPKRTNLPGMTRGGRGGRGVMRGGGGRGGGFGYGRGGFAPRGGGYRGGFRGARGGRGYAPY